MRLPALVCSCPVISASVTDFLSDREVYRGSLTCDSLHKAWGWIAESPAHSASRNYLEAQPLEVTEVLNNLLQISDRLELAASSLTAWKLFACEFSLTPQTCLSKYLGDAIIIARTA